MERIGKVISWQKEGREAGEGWIRTRISKVQIVEWRFGASDKQTGYEPVSGDRISFIIKKNHAGLEYASDITFIQTGN